MRQRYISAIMILSILTACTTELDLSNMDKTIQLNSAISMPLGTTTLTVGDIFSEEFGDLFKVDSTENSVSLYWSDILEYNVESELTNFGQGIQMQSSFAADSRLKVFPDAGTLRINKMMADAINSELQSDDNYIVEYDYDFNREENGVINRQIDSVFVNSLKLNLNIDLNNIAGISANNSNIRMIVSFPGIPELSEKIITINSNAHSERILLEDFTLVFSGGETIIPISIKFSFIIPEGKFITVNPTSDISTTLHINEIDAERVWGFFNTSDDLINSSFEINIPDEIYKNKELQNFKLLFHNPTVTLDIESNIGIPLQASIDQLSATDDKGNQVYADFNGSRNYLINIDKPAEGTTSSTRAIINRENGSTNKIFTIVPELISAAIRVNVNHQEAIKDTYHHLSFPLQFSIPIEYKLPFQLDPGTTYEYNDTIKDADISKMMAEIEGDNGNLDINDLKVTLKIENSMPLNAVAKAIFLDQNNSIVHTESDIVIPAPETDVQGRSINSAEQTIVLSAGNNIKETKQIILNFSIEAGSDTGSISYFRYNDYMNIAVGLYLKGSLQTEFN
ncbi:MAG: hypothetical protein PHV53_02660 [Fermentimonas sp.]|nr:hypothetical protein [Fermentimonas sp.]